MSSRSALESLDRGSDYSIGKGFFAAKPMAATNRIESTNQAAPAIKSVANMPPLRIDHAYSSSVPGTSCSKTFCPILA